MVGIWAEPVTMREVWIKVNGKSIPGGNKNMCLHLPVVAEDLETRALELVLGAVTSQGVEEREGSNSS